MCTTSCALENAFFSSAATASSCLCLPDNAGPFGYVGRSSAAPGGRFLTSTGHGSHPSGRSCLDDGGRCLLPRAAAEAGRGVGESPCSPRRQRHRPGVETRGWKAETAAATGHLVTPSGSCSGSDPTGSAAALGAGGGGGCSEIGICCQPGFLCGENSGAFTNSELADC